MVYTNSSIQTFLTCNRKYYYRYIRNLRKREERPDAALRYGIASHMVFESLLLGKDTKLIAEAVALQFSRWLANATPEEAEDIRTECASVLGMMMAYKKTWAAQAAQMQVIFTEHVFTLNFDEFCIKGKIDAAVRINGEVVLMEHKTALRAADEYFFALDIDNQISIYTAAMTDMGLEPAYTLYNVVQKPGLSLVNVPVIDENGDKIVNDANGKRVYTKQGKPRQTASKEEGYTLATTIESYPDHTKRVYETMLADPDKYFLRRPINRLSGQINDCFGEIANIHHRISCAPDRPSCWPRNKAACTQWGRMCPYYGFCRANTMEPQGEDFETLKNPHTELEEERSTLLAQKSGQGVGGLDKEAWPM